MGEVEGETGIVDLDRRRHRLDELHHATSITAVRHRERRFHHQGVGGGSVSDGHQMPVRHVELRAPSGEVSRTTVQLVEARRVLPTQPSLQQGPEEWVEFDRVGS